MTGELFKKTGETSHFMGQVQIIGGELLQLMSEGENALRKRVATSAIAAHSLLWVRPRNAVIEEADRYIMQQQMRRSPEPFTSAEKAIALSAVTRRGLGNLLMRSWNSITPEYRVKESELIENYGNQENTNR